MNLQLVLIEGKISNLKIGPDILDLLKAYNATVEANFEIEEFTRFACNIDEHVVEGFCSDLSLRNNDVVKAVVEKREDGSVVYSVWAILRPADGLLYMRGAVMTQQNLHRSGC